MQTTSPPTANTEPTSEQLAFYTFKDMEKLLQVSNRTVGRYWREGHIPPPVKIGGNVRWLKSDIDLWAKERCPITPNTGKRLPIKPTT